VNVGKKSDRTIAPSFASGCVIAPGPIYAAVNYSSLGYFHSSPQKSSLSASGQKYTFGRDMLLSRTIDTGISLLPISHFPQEKY
jgi:hypothetical protein